MSDDVDDCAAAGIPPRTGGNMNINSPDDVRPITIYTGDLCHEFIPAEEVGQMLRLTIDAAFGHGDGHGTPEQLEKFRMDFIAWGAIAERLSGKAGKE